MVRASAVIGASIVLLGSLAAIANVSPRMQQVGERSTAERPPTPAPTPKPDNAEPTDSPQPAAPHAPEPSRAPVETTERHVIHGSGSIGVSSGEVEEGERTSGAHASFAGPSRPPASPSP
jgi:hypothetical protein